MTVLEILRIPVLSDNYMYLLHEPVSATTGIVDPATAGPVLDHLNEKGWSLDWILSTHHHHDHTGGNLELKQTTGCKIAGPSKEAARIPGIDKELFEGDRFALGQVEATVFETPGHTAGHISYWFKEAKALFPGDTLFALGCGRLFEGSAMEMWQSLGKYAALPDDTLVYCGHEYTRSNARFALTIDPGNAELQRRKDEIDQLRSADQPTIPTRLGEERATNPFLRPGDGAIRRQLGMEQASDEDVFAEVRRRKDQF